MDLGDRVYFGETDWLGRQFQQYRTPGARQATNLRLNSMMLEVLGAADTIKLCVVTSARVKVTVMPSRSTCATRQLGCWSRVPR